MDRLASTFRALYHGRSAGAVRFQFAVILVDLAIIAFFVATPLLRADPIFFWIDYTIAALLAADICARTLAAPSPKRLFLRPIIWIDLFILVTLLAPQWLANLGFLRILRLWTISKSGFLWRPLRRRGLGEWEDTAHAFINVLTFLFVVTGFVYWSFIGVATGIDGYVDALYFTVATVTTTGFGDITLPGTRGKLTSIVVMIVGISLFVRLAQALFRPHKVTYPCPRCALQRHDPDAVHCKACGQILKIPDEDE